MAFQKGKPRPPLKVKTCAICRKSFQPSSGAQKICGEPELEVLGVRRVTAEKPVITEDP